ncbi:MAG: STM4013/SEN3800 family hydrolase [Saprospiraceae bacterium]
MLVLDALRFDAAQEQFLKGNLPCFDQYLPKEGWEKRYAPASFTYPSHKAFFAGFLPTKTNTRITPRLFATAFQGSESTTQNTFTFEENDFITALRNRGYSTNCIGGVGFFNKQTKISQEFPNLFEESIWLEELGVTEKNSTEHQFNLAKEWLKEMENKFCLYINVSAIHQPNYFYIREEKKDDLESHAAALRYVDSQLPILMDAVKAKGKCFCVFCSDHGSAYGEGGHWGHRNGHSTVMEVPYSHFEI